MFKILSTQNLENKGLTYGIVKGAYICTDVCAVCVCVLTVTNGKQIKILSSDRPESQSVMIINMVERGVNFQTKKKGKKDTRHFLFVWLLMFHVGTLWV